MPLIISSFVVLMLVFGAVSSEEKTDDEIKRQLIRESISHYIGSCPCPYNRDRDGRRCGRGSAYSRRRPGDAGPLCYESDITQQMIDTYKERLEAQKERSR